MVLIIPFPIVSDPNPWGKGFLVTQKPVLPHQIISLKNMGQQNYFLLFLWPFSLLYGKVQLKQGGHSNLLLPGW